MENMDKGLTVPKWVLIVWPKIPQNLSAQFVCPSPEVLDFNEKSLHWAIVVRECVQFLDCKFAGINRKLYNYQAPNLPREP